MARDERRAFRVARIGALAALRRAVYDRVELVRGHPRLHDRLHRRPRLPEHEPAEQHREEHHDDRAPGDTRRASGAQPRARERARAVAAPAVRVRQRLALGPGDQSVIQRARAGEHRVADVRVARSRVEATDRADVGVRAPVRVERVGQPGRRGIGSHRGVRGVRDEVRPEPQTERVHEEHGAE